VKGLGPDHRLVANVHNNLGNVYAFMGDREKSGAEYRTAIGMYEKIFGPDNTDLALTLLNLSESAEEGEKALADARRAGAIFERSLGPDHPYLAMALANQATTLLAMGRRGEAVPLYRRALAIREVKLGVKHPE